MTRLRKIGVLLPLVLGASLALWPSSALADPPKGLEGLAPADPTAVELTDFRAKLFPDNLRSFHESLSMLDHAVGRAAIATFEWRLDIAGRATAFSAIGAARRGVDTLVLVDALDVHKSRSRHRLLNAMSREGVRVFVYHPIPESGLRSFQRMHDKSLYAEQADGRALILSGGRNRSNHYLLGDDVFDVDVRIAVDPSAGRLIYSRQFETHPRPGSVVPWVADRGYDDVSHVLELAQMEEAYELSRHFFSTEMDRAPDLPEVEVRWGLFLRNMPGRPSVTRAVEAAIGLARSDVSLANAYLIPTKRMRETILAKLADRVPVAAFSNSFGSTSHTNIVRLMLGSTSGLVQAGMGLFLRKTGELHAKAASVDGRVMIVTAANLDPRSEIYDTQNGLILDSPELVRQFDHALAGQLMRGEYHVVPKTKGVDPASWCARLLLLPLKRWH